MTEHDPLQKAHGAEDELAASEAFERQHKNEVDALYDFTNSLQRMRFEISEADQEEYDAFVYRHTHDMVDDRFAATSSAFKIAALSAGIGATTRAENRSRMTMGLADLLGSEEQSAQAVHDTLFFITTDTQILSEGVNRDELFSKHAQMLDNASSYLLQGDAEATEKVAALAQVGYAMMAATPESNLYHAGMEALEPCLRQAKT